MESQAGRGGGEQQHCSNDETELHALDKTFPDARRVSSVVLPKPAGAERIVSLPSTAWFRRSINLARDTSPRRDRGTYNLVWSSGLAGAVCPGESTTISFGFRWRVRPGRH